MSIANAQRSPAGAGVSRTQPHGGSWGLPANLLQDPAAERPFRRENYQIARLFQVGPATALHLCRHAPQETTT